MPLRKKVTGFLNSKKLADPAPFPTHATSSNGSAPRSATQKVTAEELRELRELIRHKYKLDVYIWGKRNVKEFSRPEVEEKMRQADAALDAIQNRVEGWDKNELFGSDTEYRKFVEVKRRVMDEGKARWMDTPPWDIPDQNGHWFNPYTPAEAE
ncbi:hypothetical protein K491DRAFT_697044 [Lophiostoma macrostomum CBS 122681]|uniref:Uncharacterized protein n=1 Tax=Lophiostoma macrostomum CBS 122681 TaxID=1314788 RepID=A0A6A6SWY0_9PLEO|nr:hypothetical protein K491DRAFT_697044 [Lophiostoma macrostomum CBS 122681]